VSATTRAEKRDLASVHNTTRGASYALVHSSALDALEGPYLPLVVQEAAGLPLDSSFAEQKKILVRCNGLFYGCADGAEARRFNRMLINAGLITNL